MKSHSKADKMSDKNKSPKLFATVLLTFSVLIKLSSLIHCLDNEPNEPGSTEATQKCSLYKYVGVNDLGVNDIVVKSGEGNIACIKARFSLAIKVEALLDNFLEKQEEVERIAEAGDGRETGSDSSSSAGDLGERDNKFVLGYLPLETIVYVEDSCPVETVRGDEESLNSNSKGKDNDNNSDNQAESSIKEPEVLDMTIKFECAKLSFTFERNVESYFLSALRGTVHLDSSTTREFHSKDPMFFTSDLTHHFQFNDLIEVDLLQQTQGFILTANFYNLEFEAFRNTTSRSFIRPPDENSKPFSESIS